MSYRLITHTILCLISHTILSQIFQIILHKISHIILRLISTTVLLHHSHYLTDLQHYVMSPFYTILHTINMAS